MLTILKPGQGTVAVMILITAAGHADILKTDHHGRFVYFYYTDCLFFLPDIEAGLGPGSKGKFTAEIRE